MKVYAVVASDSNNTMDESVDIFQRESDAEMWRCGRMIYDLMMSGQVYECEVDVLERISCKVVNDGLCFKSALQDVYEELIGRHVWVYEKEVK